MTISPELLAAYADGELDAEAARAVEAKVAESPELQAKLAAHRALRTRLSAHFAPIADQPVPGHLRQALFADGPKPNVVDFTAQARKRRVMGAPTQWMRIAGPALAASLVLALVGMNLMPSHDYAQGDLASALDRQMAATQKEDAPVRILLSFRDKDGQYCRGFAGKDRSGIACRDDRGWRLRKLLAAAGSNTAEYRQAGSPDMAVMAAIDAMAAGPALDAVEEKRAASLGWRAKRAP
jgi:hypothetical protein